MEGLDIYHLLNPRITKIRVGKEFAMIRIQMDHPPPREAPTAVGYEPLDAFLAHASQKFDYSLTSADLPDARIVELWRANPFFTPPGFPRRATPAETPLTAAMIEAALTGVVIEPVRVEL